MIIGAFYWAFLFFGAVLVLLSALGVLAQFQDQPLDLRSIAGAVAPGARVGPEFQRDHMAGSGCLFVILVVGVGLLLSGPMILIQLPGMAPGDQSAFGLGAAATIVVGALL